MESQQSMTVDLIKQLEEEARKIQSSTIAKESTDPMEEETEDIDCEVVNEEELSEVYNNGKLIKVPESELDDYIYCEDGSYIHEDEYIEIDGGRYNPFTEDIINDFREYPYILKRPGTWKKLLIFEEDGDYNVDNFEIISISFTYNEECYWVSGLGCYVTSEDLEKYSYQVQNGNLVKIKSLEEFKAELFETYPFFEQTINSLYRDHWDINYHKLFNNFCLIIKFDEFTITNSKRHSHVIKELYVVLPFMQSANKKIIFNNNLYGGRGIMSNIEYLGGGYKHSHLSSSWDNLSNFCLGTGPISKYILQFNMNSDEHNLFSVLYNVKIYVEWESLEGTPHKHMERLGKGEISSTDVRSVNSNRLVEDYIKKGYKLPLRVFNINNVTQLKLDENILEVELSKLLNRDYIVYKNRTTGKYYEERIVTTKEIKSPNILLNYKGENIYTKTYNIDKINIQDTEYVVHPSVTKQFAENALKRIRGYYFKKISGINTGKSQYYNI